MNDYHFNTTIGVGEFSAKCEYNPIFSLHAKLNNVEKEKSDEFELQSITGKILHSLVQKSFIENFDEMLFFIIRLRYNKKDAIKKIFIRNLDSVNDYLSFVEKLKWDKPYSHETILGNQTVRSVSTYMYDHIDILAEISQEIIKIDKNGKFYCSLIDNELKIVKSLKHNIFLRGKIDSLIINKVKIKDENGKNTEINEIKIIDIKTGTTKSNTHSKQVKLYSDLLNSEINNKLIDTENAKENSRIQSNIKFIIKPELWYSNPKFKDLTKRNPFKLNIKTTNWNKTKGNLLRYVYKIVKKTCNVTHEEAIDYKIKNWKEHLAPCILCGQLCRFIKRYNLPKNDIFNRYFSKSKSG